MSTGEAGDIQLKLRKNLICLANSKKYPGRCVAGIEIIGDDIDGWIRPVGNSTGGAVSESDRSYEDGTDPRLLDLISIPFLAHAPLHSQVENWVIDPTEYWVKVGRVPWSDLASFEDAPSPIWLSDAPSTRYGQYDRTPEGQLFESSLRLIKVDELNLRVFAPGADFNNPKRRVLGSFEHAGEIYGMWVTDPIIERQYLAQDDGYYHIGEAYLTLSLAEPWEGYCHKVIAAVITEGGA